VRRLYPDPSEDVSPLREYAADDRPPPADRPWVMLNMITSADGATAVTGRSGGLGGPGDRSVFRALRDLADMILVGAGTVTAETYHPPTVSEQAAELRRERGQHEVPRLVVVTGSLRLDPAAEVFADPKRRPLVITSSAAPPERIHALAPVADVITDGRDGQGSEIDLTTALGRLKREHDARIVLCEGGPTLNGHLHGAGLVDELCLSFSPLLVGGASPRILERATSSIQTLTLRRVLEEDGTLFMRYVADR